MSTEVREPSAKYLIQAQCKDTEIGPIPSDWKIKRLRDISPNQSVGLVINPSTYFDLRGTVPMLVGSNVTENRIDWEGARRIARDSNERLPASRVYTDDLVTVRVGDPGVTAVVSKEYSGSNCASMMIVRSHPSFDSNWLCYLMNSSYGRSRIESVQYGTAQKQFNISDAIEFKYPVPPLPEQRAIAAALSDVDALIAGLEKLIAKKRDLKQAAMQQLLTGQTRLPGFSGEWKVKRLGEICEISMGRTPSRLNPAFWGAGHVWLSIADLHGKVLSSSKEQITPLGASSMRLIPKGTLLMSFKLSIGRLCFAGCDLYTNEAICGFNNLLANSDYLYYALSRTDFSLYGKQAVKGYTLNKKSLALVEVPLPSNEEQAAIANVLSSMDAELSDVENRLAKTRDLKQGMMQELLTGRTRLV
jgi:type I restriction enzyme S subunit